MKIKFTIPLMNMGIIESIINSYPEANLNDFDKHYQGDIIGSNKDFFGTTYLLVACDDGKVRECDINQCKIVTHEI